MAETYCGKSCEECIQKESLSCEGCKAGPGRPLGGDCELARCVRDKGHETCDTCCFKGNCGRLMGRGDMPSLRRRRAEAEQARKDAIARRAPILGKWLWLLFWLVIPGAIGGIMTNETVVEALPGLYLPGQIIKLICIICSAVILLKLGREEDRYRTAAICTLVTGAVSILLLLVTDGGETPIWTLLFTLPAAVIGLVGEYNEFMGHAAVLTGVDNELSEKWEALWKWHLAMNVGLIVGIPLLLIPILGIMLYLGVLIGLIVMAVLQLVYLYRTAKIFRDFGEE